MIFRIMGRLILGLLLGIVVAGTLGALIGAIDMLTGIPLAKVWLSSGLGGCVDVIICIVCCYKLVKSR